MENLQIKFIGFQYKPHVSVDNSTIKIKRRWKTKGIALQISPGKHRITVCENRVLYSWYWWIMLFNILYPIMCFRGFSGKQAGYDGECATATFCVFCANHGKVTIHFERREHPWESTPLNANYNSLIIQSNAPIHLESSDLPFKKVLRLKMSMICPFVLIVQVFSLALVLLLMQQRLSSLDIFIGCAMEAMILIYAIYKIYKIKIQKRFFECCNFSRIKVVSNKQ